MRPSRSLTRRDFLTSVASSSLGVLTAGNAESSSEEKRPVYLVPNFHPASCGWLTTFSKERVYCANSYLNHLDRVRDDPQYEFVLSEVNNVIAIMNFQPQRVAELKQRLAQGRVEFPNAYFLESTINLSGGEALMRLGALGLRWYASVFNVRPRYSWNIDVCGTHEQMPQIATELGLEALIYTRKNPTGKTLFWSLSPDGSKILTLCPGHYSEAGQLFSTKVPLSADELAKINTFFDTKEPVTPPKAPLLVLAGSGDYALAPLVKGYPSQLLSDWKAANLGREIRFCTLSKYIDAIRPGLNSGAIDIPSSRAGTAYDFDAFWIENPAVKTKFRSSEHALQSAEILASLAAFTTRFQYPAKPLYDSWILLCLNMDRNTLWGSAGGMVFVDQQSWNVQDRFEYLSRATSDVVQEASRYLLGSGQSVGIFNPLNWSRNDPFVARLPHGTAIEGASSEPLPDGSTLVQMHLPAVSIGAWKPAQAAAPPATGLPSETVETRFYSVRLDASTGAITSLRLKADGREIFSAPANVIVAERPLRMPKPQDDPGDFMPPRPQRTRLASSSDGQSETRMANGPVAITLETTGTFLGGGVIRRSVRFYHDYPRIDFVTELNDVPNYTVVVAEFPLRSDITDIRRGIPFGFSHGAWSKPDPDLPGWTRGIVPAVRWIDYALAAGGGFAIFDRGCCGRELVEQTPVIYLLNAEDKYYGYANPWLSGKGRHTLEYALVAYDGDWSHARVPQLAWEYNCAPLILPATRAARPTSYVQTSENLILEALRRESDYVELRLVECLGVAAQASFSINLPHRRALLTDATGKQKSVIAGGPHYQIDVRPQQILTIRLLVDSSVPVPEPITAWDSLVPPRKRAALHAYDPNTIGHPPKGS